MSASARRLAALLTACAVLGACGGGGGGSSNSGGPAPPTPAPPVSPPVTPPAAANAFLPTDTQIAITYGGQAAPARFEAAAQQGSLTVAPFRYAIGGKEYFVSAAASVAFAGFYSPVVIVSGAGVFTADAHFDTPIVLFNDNSQAQQFIDVSGVGNITITPTYGVQPLRYSGRVIFFGTEPIQTPAGTFPSKRVRLEIVVETTIQGTVFYVPYDVDLWFARGIGIVQRGEVGQLLTLAAVSGPDGDADGVFDGIDVFPNDPSESRDLDADGTGDNRDLDDDGDSVADTADRFPRDAAESADLDNDGTGDNADSDDDNDGLFDSVDPFPRDIHNTDTDQDGTADFYDADDDNDLVADAADPFPLNGAEWLDSDHDGTGDNGDFDDDNDGRPDDLDAYPFDPVRTELLGIDRTAISLSATFGSAVKPAAFVNVTGDQISWQVESSAPWLALTTPNGTFGDAFVTVEADTLALAVGTHTAQVTLRDLGDARALTVDVTVTVALPVLSTTLDHLAFDGTYGWSNLTRPFDVTLNTGLNAYPVTVEVLFPMADAIATSYVAGVASIDPRRFELTLDPAALRRGRHTGTLTLRADVLGRAVTRTIPIEATASQHVVYPSADGVAFTRMIYSTTPFLATSFLTRTVRVLDSYGVAGTAWTASSDQPWLSVTGSGVSGGDLVLTADPTGLADGLHWATVSIASPDDNVEATRSVRVSLWLAPHTLYVTAALPAVYRQLVSDPMRPYVYAHDGASTIDVYHVHTHTAVTSIGGLGGVLGPMVTSTDGRWLFVLDPTTGSVTRINLDNTAVRTTWPLLENKPFGQPSAFVYVRASGHPVLLLNDGRVVDAGTGSIFPTGHIFTLPSFQIAKASPYGERVCLLQQVSPVGGACFKLLYGDQNVPDVKHSPLVAFSGVSMPGIVSGGRDVAFTADGEQVIVAMEQYPYPLVRFSVSGSYLGPVSWNDADGNALYSAHSVATAADGAIAAYVVDLASGENRLLAFNPSGSERTNIVIGANSPTGLVAQFVMSGDTKGSAFLTGDAPPLPTTSETLHFLGQ